MTTGYKSVWFKGSVQLRSRVVAEKLLGRPLPEGIVIHHKDGDPMNDDPSNLEALWDWEHRSRHNTGEAHNNTKLTEEQAREVKFSKDRGVDLAKKFGISPVTVSEIRHGRRWGYLTPKNRQVEEILARLRQGKRGTL